MEINSEATTEELLALSVQQYNALLEHAQKLIPLASAANYVELESHSKELNDLQAEAQLNDKKLLPALFYEPLKWQANVLFQQRQELIQGIIDFNKKMMPSLQAVMALAAADMDRLQAGRAAVASYTVGMRSNVRLKSTA